MTATPDPLRLCLVDMNNGVANEATRCFRRLFDAFSMHVREANPGLEITLQHVQPRNLGELPDPKSDLILSSGGPGAPTDGYEEDWCNGYRRFVDSVVDRTLRDPSRAPSLFAVCHSFEICVQHFGVATMARRENLRFGVFPAYVTEAGRASIVFKPFEDGRLFTWEHRRFEAVDLDERKLAGLGGRLLARESREGREDKGRGVMGLQFAPGVVGTQFHPEADRPGVMAWVQRREHSDALRDAYGHELLERMLKTLSDPTRLARTYALAIPGWLAERFNHLAEERGLRKIPAPHTVDMSEFEDRHQATA
jgi:GMP synthase-like glutamine amidotransferase